MRSKVNLIGIFASVTVVLYENTVMGEYAEKCSVIIKTDDTFWRAVGFVLI